MQGPSTFKIHADPTGQAPPPYSSEFSGVTVENCVNSSESLSQLLDKRNVLQIAPGTAIGSQVHDGNGTLLLSILSQPLSGPDWWTRNIFLNSSGRPVMEMKSINDGKGAQVFNQTWTVYEGGRVAGILEYFDDKSELVGYRISGEEMFRTVAGGPQSWTVKKGQKDVAAIANGNSPYTRALAVYNEEEELEVKALLLCATVYYDSVCLKGSIQSLRTSETPQQLRTPTNTREASWLTCYRVTIDKVTRLLLILGPGFLVFMFFKELMELAAKSTH